MLTLSSAHSTLKAQGPAGLFAGLAWCLATTPDSDRDVVLPSALRGAADRARMTSDFPVVRIAHQPRDLGRITGMNVDAQGLHVEGAFNMADPAARSAFEQVATGEFGALSLGFDGSMEESGAVRVFTSIEISEISVCAHGRNLGSRVRAVKSWSACDSEHHFRELLHSTGVPIRLAKRIAAVSWPTISRDPENETARQLALDRLLRVTSNL